MQTAFIPPKPSRLLLEMPKCNIHTHLEGSVRPETFLELASQQNVPLPFPASEVGQKLQVDGNEKTLVDYLDKIGHNYPILKNGESLRRTTYEAAEDAHRDGVIYFELRAGPALHTCPGLSIEAVIENILTGLHEAESRLGIVTGFIVAGLRNHDPETNTRLATTACRYMQQGVLGFDLAGDEAGFPVSLHEEAFKVVQRAGLPCNGAERTCKLEYTPMHPSPLALPPRESPPGRTWAGISMLNQSNSVQLVIMLTLPILHLFDGNALICIAFDDVDGQGRGL